MSKNTLKQILAVAAFGCIAAAGNAQMRYSVPMYSGRMGGALVASANIGYYNNSILGYNTGVPRFYLPGPMNNGLVSQPSTGSGGVTRMPSDGRIVVQATPGMIGAPVSSGSFSSGGVTRMPSDGRIVVQSATAGMIGMPSIGTSSTGQVTRMPADGRIVVQSGLKR
jgi:hypothetical protein